MLYKFFNFIGVAGHLGLEIKTVCSEIEDFSVMSSPKFRNLQIKIQNYFDFHFFDHFVSLIDLEHDFGPFF